LVPLAFLTHPAKRFEKDHADHRQKEQYGEQLHRFGLHQFLIWSHDESREQLANVISNSRIDLDVKRRTKQDRQTFFDLSYVERRACESADLMPSISRSI
jgi:hypothetical protein